MPVRVEAADRLGYRRIRRTLTIVIGEVQTRLTNLISGMIIWTITANWTLRCIIAEVRKKLEDLLKKYNELMLEEDEKQNILHTPIPEYRKLIEPLIKTGVYRESNSPHNNPVMLVAKKTKGQFRLIVDNRQSN